MNLIVTGGCGFIGSHFIEHVIDKPEVETVVNVDCLTYAGSLENTKSFGNHTKYVHLASDIGTIVDRFQFDGCVVHFAAESHVDNSIVSPDAFIQTNIVGTFKLLQACRNAKRFLHVSTDEVYGSIMEGSFTEDSPYRPNSPYSASKAASDHLVRAYHKTHGLPAIITHSVNNYGPRQNSEKLIPKAIKCCLSGQRVPVYGDGMNLREWVHVKDHCEALWQILTRGTVGESYNIGGEEHSNLSVLHHIFKRMIVDSGKACEFVEDRKGHDRRYSVDDSKLRKELGWSPAIEFEDGIRETVNWYVENL